MANENKPEAITPAAALALKRWEGTTKAQRSDHGRMMARKRWGKRAKARRAGGGK